MGRSKERGINCSNRTFMELKFMMLEATRKLLLGSNRTFMELKFRKQQAKDIKKICSNRTFMELK